MNVKLLRSTDASSVHKPNAMKSPVVRNFAIRSRSSIREPKLWFGVVLLVVSIGLTHVVLGKSRVQTSAIVAIHDLAPGTMITPADVHVESVPVSNTAHFASRIEDVVGHSAVAGLFAGDVVRTQDVAANVSTLTRNVSVLVRAGHLPAVAHGSTVDVWVTPSLEGMAAPGPATLALSNVVVDSAPDAIDPTTDSSVTLTVAPDQVRTLVQAMRDGLIDLVVVPVSSVTQ